MPSSIGIKIANGEFYPILEENSAVKKRLILTTVHNKQASVHIDLYKSNAWAITDAFYIGSLVVENIKSKPGGEPSIELVLSSNQNGEILADAVDLDTPSKGAKKSLNVSLTSLYPGDSKISDFEVDYQDQGALPLGLYEPVRDKKNIPWLKLTGIFLCIGMVCLALWFFLSKMNLFHVRPSLEGATASYPPGTHTSADPLEPATEPEMPVPPGSPKEPQSAATTTADPERDQLSEPEPEVIAEPAQALAVVVTPDPAMESETGAKPEPAPEPAVLGLATPQIIESPALPLPPKKAALKRIRPSPPVASYKVPTTIPRGGVSYKVRWGDTLWDISEAFYRNPWLYPRIARFNNIRNSDIIISGKTIRIPPKK